MAVLLADRTNKQVERDRGGRQVGRDIQNDPVPSGLPQSGQGAKPCRVTKPFNFTTMLLTYERLQSLMTIIEAAKATQIKTSLQIQIEYRGKDGYIEFNTNGIVDLVIGKSVKYVFEIARFYEDKMRVNAWDKVLDRVTEATIHYDEISTNGILNMIQHD